MQSFDIYFLGEMLPDADPVTARQGVARLFKIQEGQAERLFSGKPVRVKQGIDVDTAGRYRGAFRDVGAHIRIVPTGSPPPDPITPAPQPAPTTQTPRPAESTQDDPPPLAEVSEGGEFELAEPGAIIDHKQPPPPAEIDTGSLEALPANTGSLEDCRNDKPPQAIPDISHMQLVDD